MSRKVQKEAYEFITAHCIYCERKFYNIDCGKSFFAQTCEEFKKIYNDFKDSECPYFVQEKPLTRIIEVNLNLGAKVPCNVYFSSEEVYREVAEKYAESKEFPKFFKCYKDCFFFSSLKDFEEYVAKIKRRDKRSLNYWMNIKELAEEVEK